MSLSPHVTNVFMPVRKEKGAPTSRSVQRAFRIQKQRATEMSIEVAKLSKN
jgi:hypothetical protein